MWAISKLLGRILLCLLSVYMEAMSAWQDASSGLWCDDPSILPEGQRQAASWVHEPLHVSHLSSDRQQLECMNAGNKGPGADGMHEAIPHWFYWSWNANSGDTGVTSLL